MAPRRPGDLATVIADAGLARRELGWSPQYDELDRIVADALAWERILATKNSTRGTEPPEPAAGTAIRAAMTMCAAAADASSTALSIRPDSQHNPAALPAR